MMLLHRFKMIHVNTYIRQYHITGIINHSIVVMFKQTFERRLSAFGNGNDTFFNSINKQNSPYVTPQGSRSVTNLLNTTTATTTSTTSFSKGLKRSNTTPTKIAESKEHEPFQTVFINDNIDINRSLTSCKWLYIM
jgi:hypothetical protein